MGINNITKDTPSGGFVINLSSGYGIGGRILDDGGVSVYEEGLLSAHNSLSRGDVVGLYDSQGNRIESGERTSFSSSWNGQSELHPSLGEDASKFIDVTRQKLRDPLQMLAEDTKKLYEQIMSPIKINPVMATTTTSDLKQIGYSISYPVSLPLMTLYHMLKGNFKGHGGNYVVMGLIFTPSYLYSRLKDGKLFQEYVAGVSIANPDILSTSPIDKNSMMLDISTGDSGEKGPHFFGNSSSIREKYAYLHGFFPGGLEVSGSHIGQIPNKNYDPFKERGKWFMQVPPELHEEVVTISENHERIWADYRALRDNVRLNMASILRGGGILS